MRAREALPKRRMGPQMVAEDNDPGAEAFRLLAESIPQKVFVCSSAGRPQYYNGRFLNYVGGEFADAARDAGSVWHESDREGLGHAWQGALAAGEEFEYEGRLRSSLGTYRWHLTRAVPVRDARGNVERWYGTLTDIEDRKRTEETLRVLADVSQRFSRTLGTQETIDLLAESAIENFADWCSIYRFDASGKLVVGAIAHKDPAKVSLANELAKRYPLRADEPTTLVAQGAEAMLLSDIDDAMIRRGAIDDEHYRIISALGLCSAMILPLQARGEALGALSLISAESNRQYDENDFRLAQALALRASLALDSARALEQLAQSEDRFRQLAETIPPLVWISRGGDGRIDYVNRRWKDYFGLSDDESAQWLMRDFVHPDDFDLANDKWKRSLQTGEPYEVQYRLMRTDGTYHWFLAHGIPVSDATGMIVQWFGSATDIDDSQRAFERTKHIVDTLQKAFIPARLPTTPLVTFDAAYLPAENDARVGGDWYDAFVLDNGTVVFSIGDVAGHGLEAAVTMGNVRQAIVGSSIDTRNPVEVLEKVNRILLLQHSIMASAIVGFIHDGFVRYAIAGHPPPVLATGDHAQFLAFGGLPLGVDRDPEFASGEFRIESGSLLVLYTDGLTEAKRNVNEAETILLDVCKRAVRTGMWAADIRDSVLAGIEATDDIALMTLRF